MKLAGSATSPRYACPACRAAVTAHDTCYTCIRCRRDYPILFNIPDFRLRADRYLSLEAEREKARRLFEAASKLSFAELLSYYYSITDDVTPVRVKVYSGYVIDGPARATEDLTSFGAVGSNAALLDAGCGAGSGLVAAHGGFRSATGIDIALRWLVLCRKRLVERGIEANLVCGDIESPPFEPGQFTHVLGADVIEHVSDQGMAVKALAKQLAPGGLLWLSAINRWWLGPHPSTGRWAASYRSPTTVPGGYDPLRHIAPISPAMTQRLCRDAGLEVLSIKPRRVRAAHASGRSPAERFAIRAYAGVQSVQTLRSILVAAGPAFELVARVPKAQGGH